MENDRKPGNPRGKSPETRSGGAGLRQECWHEEGGGRRSTQQEKAAQGSDAQDIQRAYREF